jgi:hypothetical protein
MQYGFSFAKLDSPILQDIVKQAYIDTGSTLYRFSIDWSGVENERGTYNWSTLDARIAWLRENNIKLLMTIRSNAPDWAAATKNDAGNGATIKPENMDDFDNFVSSLLDRYKDVIHIVQFGNEWQDSNFFPGTKEEYVSLNDRVYTIVKEKLPKIPFALGGFSTAALRIFGIYSGTLTIWRQNRSTKLGNPNEIFTNVQYKTVAKTCEYVLEQAKYDAIDVHLYYDIDEWDEHITTIRKYDKTSPIIVSEWGATQPVWNPNPSDETLAINMQKALKKLSTLDVVEIYHFLVLVGEASNKLFEYCGITSQNEAYPKLYETYVNFLSEQRNHP